MDGTGVLTYEDEERLWGDCTSCGEYFSVPNDRWGQESRVTWIVAHMLCKSREV